MTRLPLFFALFICIGLSLSACDSAEFTPDGVVAGSESVAGPVANAGSHEISGPDQLSGYCRGTYSISYPYIPGSRFEISNNSAGASFVNQYHSGSTYYAEVRALYGSSQFTLTFYKGTGTTRPVDTKTVTVTSCYV